MRFGLIGHIGFVRKCRQCTQLMNFHIDTKNDEK
jgi:hypothetical protein